MKCEEVFKMSARMQRKKIGENWALRNRINGLDGADITQATSQQKIILKIC